METLIAATHNANKLREFRQILPGWTIEGDSPDVEETEETFAGNALLKARACALRHPGAWVAADDSGLCVDALGGDPGVRSARYAGKNGDTPANNALLLKNLAGAGDRSAHFVCAIAVVSPDGEEHVFDGRCDGRIAEAPSGDGGFGYDPLFVPSGHEVSFASLSADEKNAISHRGRALSKMAAWFGSRIAR
jgi:XTP/dITP diphosphohydrolase